MKKLVALVVVALVVVGIVKVVSARSPEAKAERACENLIEQCGSFAALAGEKLTSSDADECADGLADEGQKALGDRYEPMMTCMADANSCGEALGCLTGAFAGELGERWTASRVASSAR
jgi:hypothetical protein